MPEMDPSPGPSLGYCDDFDFTREWNPRLLPLPTRLILPKVHSYGGLIAIRLCLGLCEGGLLPGMTTRVSAAVGDRITSYEHLGLLATAITKMEGVGGLAGWRWIYVNSIGSILILEGLATVVASLIAAYILPADIESASFFTDEERSFALKRLRKGDVTISDGALTAEKDVAEVTMGHLPAVANAPDDIDGTERFELGEVVRGLVDIQTWLTGFAYFGLIVSLYSYSLFLPTIVSGLGYSGGAAQLHTVPPYIPAVALTVIVAVLSDRLRWRGPFILICLPLAAIGYILAITAKTNGTRYIAVFFMAAGVSILPNNGSGHYKKATTTALQLAIANAGTGSGFIATFAYTQGQYIFDNKDINFVYQEL
ncbi:hypothetical protein DXG01_006328 [Tephrocybe rancida]|nr:hypothetical protein DXG01_006328 [Tephrocybe rancida]